MDKRKKLISFLAGLMALIMLLGLIAGFIPTAHAVTSGELKAQLDELQEEKDIIDAQIAEISGQIAANNDDMKSMVAQKDLIDQEIALLHQQEENINGQIATYSLMIADKQELLSEAEANFAELTEKNKARIQSMEEEGQISYWSVLFQANDFPDLLDRLNMVQEIAVADQRRLKELDEAAKAVSEAKASLEVEKTAVEQVKAELTQTQQQLEVKRQEAGALLAEMVEKGLAYDVLMEESEALQEKLMADIASKEDEYEHVKYQEWLATSIPPTEKPAPPSDGGGGGSGTNTVGGLTWHQPIFGFVFTSAFGWRIHPIYGDSRFHSGVDLAAPEGTPIYATRSGVVDTADYQAGGAGYRSIYMHMTHYIVGYGEYVSQGQVIGYCGTTGGSTGPHLHFGISYNGEYVNPANYISVY